MGAMQDAYTAAAQIQAETVINANTSVRVGLALKKSLLAMGGEEISFTAGATLSKPMAPGTILFADVGFTCSACGGTISGYALDGTSLTRTLRCWALTDTGLGLVNVTSLSGSMYGFGVIHYIDGTYVNVIMVSNKTLYDYAKATKDIVDTLVTTFADPGIVYEAAFGPGGSDVTLRKTGTGFVEMKGLFGNVTPFTPVLVGDFICTLPAGYRPANLTFIFIPSTILGAADDAYISVGTDGKVHAGKLGATVGDPMPIVTVSYIKFEHA